MTVRRVGAVPCAAMDAAINLTVNGQRRTVTTDASRPLLDVLREDLGLTGTKYGCGEGRCGSCTVLLDGKRVYSCQLSIGEAADKAVVTIEGLARGETLHPAQEAFLEVGGFQCGYCTPGMIVSTAALLREKPRPTDEEIKAWMNRHICRCCSYPNITRAVKRAAELAGQEGAR